MIPVKILACPNAHPYRLDIDWRLCKYAKEKGVKIAINPDAYDEEGLKNGGVHEKTIRYEKSKGDHQNPLQGNPGF